MGRGFYFCQIKQSYLVVKFHHGISQRFLMIFFLELFLNLDVIATLSTILGCPLDTDYPVEIISCRFFWGLHNFRRRCSYFLEC